LVLFATSEPQGEGAKGRRSRKGLADRSGISLLKRAIVVQVKYTNRKRSAYGSHVRTTVLAG
jgi:hypothetical protein